MSRLICGATVNGPLGAGAEGGCSLTVADADLIACAWLVAVMVTVLADAMLAGAV